MLLCRPTSQTQADKLTDELVRLTNSAKAGAVRVALIHEIARRRASLPMRKRLAKSLEMARAIGPFAPGDHKAKTDEMSGED